MKPLKYPLNFQLPRMLQYTQKKANYKQCKHSQCIHKNVYNKLTKKVRRLRNPQIMKKPRGQVRKINQSTQ